MGLSLFLCSLIFLIAAVFFMFFDAVLGDGDSGWHLAAGRHIVDHFVIPTTDPFSYTFQGQPWVAHEWLSEVAMYGGYAVSGWSGVVVLCGLAFAITLGPVDKGDSQKGQYLIQGSFWGGYLDPGFDERRGMGLP